MRPNLDTATLTSAAICDAAVALLLIIVRTQLGLSTPATSGHTRTLLAAAAWSLLVQQSGMAMPMTATIFIGLWVVMMVAMMFPTAAPMILVFHRVHTTRRERGQAFVPTWIFVAGYLIAWTAYGLLAYGLYRVAKDAAPDFLG